ncbi:dTDP-4-dehydrorhamnose 3,5-epimerase family protein [Undibacterium cyanobacteriorum]|uniref:dTDP-4-dehydrorhamnose 3,5-epimerase n=1 Tax=Undibacterium cyanobacteriorum TaxID=3073561 RepID=A0ABY9RNF4_9BURK|nr:dTDP-4-dehydrorhamnose 3,5-epimerase family protein [Undibacterium sp. 20NA77.5]WMW82230.1 dTDP-4-dehydrorhamnose 3,5-epimerase family protein [Undibacterium sp. 20NA77.5]
MTVAQASLFCTPTPIAGVMVVKRIQRGDQRGMFERMYDKDLLASFGWTSDVVQVNHSVTRGKGTVRGMHFQRAPFSEYKLVSCLVGEVWDVALDLRRGSPSFLQHFAVKLSPHEANALLIPPGCAHGFQTLTEQVDMLYCHNQPYMKSHEDGINASDPRLNLVWPLEITQRSERDLEFAYLTPSFEGV